jgi:hypothetical protein
MTSLIIDPSPPPRVKARWMFGACLIATAYINDGSWEGRLSLSAGGPVRDKGFGGQRRHDLSRRGDAMRRPAIQNESRPKSRSTHGVALAVDILESITGAGFWRSNPLAGLP